MIRGGAEIICALDVDALLLQPSIFCRPLAPRTYYISLTQIQERRKGFTRAFAKGSIVLIGAVDTFKSFCEIFPQ